MPGPLTGLTGSAASRATWGAAQTLVSHDELTRDGENVYAKGMARTAVPTDTLSLEAGDSLSRAETLPLFFSLSLPVGLAGRS